MLTLKMLESLLFERHTDCSEANWRGYFVLRSHRSLLRFRSL